MFADHTNVPGEHLHPSERDMLNLPTLIGIIGYFSYVGLFIGGVII